VVHTAAVDPGECSTARRGAHGCGCACTGQVGGGVWEKKLRTQSTFRRGSFQRVECAVRHDPGSVEWRDRAILTARWSAKGETLPVRIYLGRWCRRPYGDMWLALTRFRWMKRGDEEAAARFVGVHDFASFAASTGSGRRRQGAEYGARDFCDGIEAHGDGKSCGSRVHGRSFFEGTWCGRWWGRCWEWKREVDGRGY